VFKHILLASHGTVGALVAECKAMSMCTRGSKIHHLVVVPSFWKGMTGDDWLNNGNTRDQFCRYLENTIGHEVESHCERVRKNAGSHKLRYSNEIALGEPSSILIEASKKEPFDLIVMGSPRPKGIKGLRSRMFTKDLVQCLQIPLLVVPYPH
jgi:nucleotide-binding universal stress UspA family protein